MKKAASMILTDTPCRVIYIQPSKKEIYQHSVAILDSAEFSRFCNATGLSWLYRYFPNMTKLAECMGEFISKGSNEYLSSAIATHGLRVIPIGQYCYMLALSCDSAPAEFIKEGLFCYQGARSIKEKYCASALIFSVKEQFSTETEEKTYSQMDCPLSIDTISELYSFDCMLPTPTVDSTSIPLVATIKEEAGIKEISGLDSMGQSVPGMQRSVKQIALAVPKYYGDTLIQLGYALKNQPADFNDISYDLTSTPLVTSIPDFAVYVLKDLYNKIAIFEGDESENS